MYGRECVCQEHFNISNALNMHVHSGIKNECSHIYYFNRELFYFTFVCIYLRLYAISTK